MALMPKGVTGVLSYFTRHPTAANLLLVIMIALGLAATTQLRSQFFPDVVIQEVTVSVNWDGAGPEDIDSGVVAVLEPVLIGVEGVTSTSSSSREGTARIELEFEPGWDMSRAADDVDSAIQTVTNLPEGVDDPTVRRGAWRDRVTDVVIHGPVSVEQLGAFADEFTARLFREGVTRTSIRGIASPEILVEVPEANLIQHDISLRDVASVIGAEAETAPAGDMASGASRVRTGVEKRTAEEIAKIVIRSNEDGSKLMVGDVATITEEGSASGRTYYKGDNPAISIRVDRADQGDAISMQTSVEEVAAALEAELPAGVKIELIRTRAEAITGRLNILYENGLIGLGLVLILLFLFLSARTAFWVAAGIPAAMFAALALMYISGLTINMISLFALIICLGIVVDDAIVVGEHADFRARRLGEDPVVASERAAKRMALPVFSATITTVIAFFGLTAIGGRFGTLIVDIPFTVIVVLIASLVECFLILPNHMSHALKAQKKEAWYDWPSRQFNRGFRTFRDHVFRPMMVWVIRLRYPVLASVVVILALTLSMFLRGDVTWRFFNAPERGSISGNFAMLPGASRDDTLEMMRELQRATEAVAARFEAEHGTNPVTFALGEVGGTTGRGLAGSDTKEPEQLGSIAIELIDADLRPYSSFTFLGALQDEVRRHPLLETLSFRGWRSGPGGDSLNVKFYGADATTLKAASEALKQAVSRFPEVSAVEDNLSYDKTELVVDLTPAGQSLGFTIDEVGRQLRERLSGIEAAEFPVGTRAGTITVGLPEAELTADFLSRTRLRSPQGAWTPLSEIVTVSSSLGFSTVLRENGLRVVTVTGDISEDDPVRAEEITRALGEEILPQVAGETGVLYVQGGLAEQERDFLNDAMIGLILCLMGIYLTLAWIFSSWARPMVVMLIIPFGLVGTIFGHYQWDVPLSMFTVVGLIGMTGIIINDSIVLVTTIDEYAEERGLMPAIADAAADRLRPVLLTTLTTVLGLAPLLYETSQQAQFLKPTVITLAYGLGFGMVLVLLIVPALVASQQDIARLRQTLQRALRGQRFGAGARAFVWLSLLGGLGWGAATLGAYALTGAAWAPLGAVLPEAAGPGLLFLVMVAGVGLWQVLLGVLAFALPKRRASV
ncbi:MAG: efflux RND transporter permease subunit [Pseudomonadota bacterium]